MSQNNKHVLRLFAGTFGEDWFKSKAYGEREIDQIRDPEGGTGKFLPTAIPSPFARFDLVHTAFLNLSRTEKLETQTIPKGVIGSKEEEKLVSDALDVLEILFNYYQFADNLQIIPWDTETDLGELLGGIPAHRHIGRVLDMYIRQDNDTYLFSRMQRLYTVVLNNKVIGCTSPVSVTAATGNMLQLGEIRATGNYKFFDDTYEALYQRDEAFQLFVYRLFRCNAAMTDLRGINEYLRKNASILADLNPKLYSQIEQIAPGDYRVNYSEIDTGIAGNTIEVNGIPLRCQKKEDQIRLARESDFIIRASLPVEGLVPMVLQNQFSKSFRYLSGTWDRNQPVSYFDPENDLNKRRLPGQQVKYPYLTVSDFLEPYLIRLVYPIDKTRFFDGNLIIDSGNANIGYLPPLKPAFFRYFHPSELSQSIPGSGPYLRMRQIAGGSVQVELQIPVKKDGEYVTLSRIYEPGGGYEPLKPDEATNKGAIVRLQFGIAVFPFVRYTGAQKTTPAYRIQLIDRNIDGFYRNQDIQLEFSERGSTITPTREAAGNNKQNSGRYGSHYYSLENDFDLIRVHAQQVRAIIIPRWEKFGRGDGGNPFSFAIDFGTSNTHIEYTDSQNGTPKPFTFKEGSDEIPLAILGDLAKAENFDNTNAYAIRDAVAVEFFPRELHQDAAYRFPQRTVIGMGKLVKPGEGMLALCDGNIAFCYEKQSLDDLVNLVSNLKWHDQQKNGLFFTKLFFEQLFLMIRAKVLLQGGNLDQTRIVWSFPFSMSPGRVRDMKGLIGGLYEKLISSQRTGSNIFELPESLGPFYYYEGINLLTGNIHNKPSLSIDIGGGTTDVMVFRGYTPEAGLSFRFAANALFGDLQNSISTKQHGLMRAYAELLDSRLDTTGNDKQRLLLNELIESQGSADVASFLFSLRSNSDVRESASLDFSTLLSRNDHIRINFLFFYVAILYHIAQFLKARQVGGGLAHEIPGNLIFSGNGSKILETISPDPAILGLLAQQIFSDVMDISSPEKVGIIMEKKELKEVTARGSIYFLKSAGQVNAGQVAEFNYHPAAPQAEKVTVAMVDNDFFTAYNNAMIEFADYFIGLNGKINFKKELNISSESLATFMQIVHAEIATVEDGFAQLQRFDQIDTSSGREAEIPETLFFYPVIRVIQKTWVPLMNIQPLQP